MLTKVEVRTSQGGLLSLPLEDIISGLIVENIDGLDPVKATLVSSSFAGLDGEQYQSARRETRNIKIRVALEPDYSTESVQDLRRRVYSYFMPKSEVSLRFYMTNAPATVDIVGRVESCETALFSQEPAIDISIICYDPDFFDPTVVTLSGNTVSTATETLVDYKGSVESGIRFTLNVNRTLSAFTIYHRLPNDELRILDFAASLLSGDLVQISTIVGDKGATLTRSGTTSSILYAISPQSNWTEFAPGGDNFIQVYATGAAIPYSIDYINKYGGL